MSDTGIDFQAIAETVPSVIIVLDSQLTILWANKKAREAAPVPPEGGKCYQVYMDRQTPCTDCHTLETFKTGKALYNESRVDYDNGSSRYFQGHTVVAGRDKNGKIIKVAEIAAEALSKSDIKDPGAMKSP